jgi:hypothetical protein
MDTVGGAAPLQRFRSTLPWLRDFGGARRAQHQRRHQNAGLPEFRTNMCRKSGKPDLR